MLGIARPAFSLRLLRARRRLRHHLPAELEPDPACTPPTRTTTQGARA